MSCVTEGYFKVRRGISTRGYTLALSSDGARWAVIRMWDRGKEVGGSFDSEEQLREEMGGYYRHVPELRSKGWLDDLDVHDWDKDQRDPDPTRAARQARHRAKIAAQKAGAVTVVTASNGEGNGTSNGVTNRYRGVTETETEVTNVTSHGSPERPDVEELCDLLADLLVRNGARNKPRVSAEWRTSARLLLDVDHAPFAEVLRVMRWALADSFWQSNIQSLPKFRKQYEQLRSKSGEAKSNGLTEWQQALAEQEGQELYLAQLRGEAT